MPDRSRTTEAYFSACPGQTQNIPDQASVRLGAGFFGGSLLAAELCLEQANDRGQDRDDQDQDDDQLEMLLDCGDAAEEIAQEGEEGGPYQAAQDTEGGEASPAHSGDARYEGHEGPDEGEEASQDHGQGAPLVDQAFGLGDSFGGQ